MKAVIMAGGKGTRFWPLSVESNPKQFLNISGNGTMLQETVDRLLPLVGIEDVYVVCSAPYLDLVQRQLPELSDEQLIIEPAARNTAPCIGLAAHYLQERFPNETMVVLPADHVIQDREAFHSVLKAAESMAAEGWLVTFGMEPDFPSTGYGYLEMGEPLGGFGSHTGFRVARFIEKPVLEKAQQFLRDQRYLWNSGMFVWRTDTILEEMRLHMPDLFSGLSEIATVDDDQKALEIFSRLEKTSIDFGIMERTEKAAMIPCSIGWDDVGSWGALKRIRTPDLEGNWVEGLVEAVDSTNSVVFGGGSKLVALVGVEDLVVVDTEDVLLVCSGKATEDVKRLVDRLKQKKLSRFL